MSEDRFGTALKPKKIKCTSVGVPSPTRPYLCIVVDENNQHYYGMTFDQARLFSAQMAEVVAAWPAEPA
jgi:hypothetical protein